MTANLHHRRSGHRPMTGILLSSCLIGALLAFPLTESLAQSPSDNVPATGAPDQTAAPIPPSQWYGYGPGPIPGQYSNQYPSQYPSQYHGQYPSQTPYPPSAYAGYGPSRSRAANTQGAARFSRSMPELVRDITDQGYRLTIRLAPDQKAADIQIEPRGRGLLISSKRERVSRSEQHSQDGAGYRRSFSFSSGGFQRRIGVPPDADLSAMTRSNDENAVVLILPRR